MPPKKLNQQEPSAVPDVDELKSIAAKSDSPEDKLKEAAASAESALASAKTASSQASLPVSTEVSPLSATLGC